MKRLYLYIGFFILVLLLYGCKNKKDEINYLDTLLFNTSDPLETQLATLGLTIDNFNTIKYSISGYHGFIYDYSDLMIVWTERNLNDFDILKDLLYELLGDKYQIKIYTIKTSKDGIFIPEGTIIGYFY